MNDQTPETPAEAPVIEMQIPVVPVRQVGVLVQPTQDGKAIFLGPLVLAIPLTPESAKLIGGELVASGLAIVPAGALPRMDIPRKR